MNKTSSEKNMLIDTINRFVKDKYGDSYGAGESFSRLCPSIYELERKELQGVVNLLCNKPYAETPWEGELGIKALMCAVEGAADTDRYHAMAKRGSSMAKEIDTGLGRKVFKSFLKILSSPTSPSKTHAEPDNNKDVAEKNNPSTKGRILTVQTKQKTGRNTENTGRLR